MRDAGLSYRQLDYWISRGVLVPLERHAEGSGYPRPFPAGEVRVARALRQLRQIGATMPVLREVAAQLRVFSDTQWHGLIFVDQVGLVRREPCGLAWVIDLSIVAGSVGLSARALAQ